MFLRLQKERSVGTGSEGKGRKERKRGKGIQGLKEGQEALKRAQKSHRNETRLREKGEERGTRRRTGGPDGEVKEYFTHLSPGKNDTPILRGG